MTDANMPAGATPSTAVTRTKPPLPPAVQEAIEANRVKNAIVQQIKGTMWAKDLSGETIRAVAQYCRENGLDPVRHVEMLGGRIYLTAEFYQERGAPFVRDGSIRVGQTDFIHADPRLDEVAKGADEELAAWAKKEKSRRLMLRIRHGVPENAKAAAIVPLTVVASGTVYEGVNWCGGLAKKDPVGDAEPTKTAETRSARRAWKRAVEAVPQLHRDIAPIEARAVLATAEIGQLVDAEPKALPKTSMLSGQEIEPEPMPSVPLKVMPTDAYGDGEEAA